MSLDQELDVGSIERDLSDLVRKEGFSNRGRDVVINRNLVNFQAKADIANFKLPEDLMYLVVAASRREDNSTRLKLWIPENLFGEGFNLFDFYSYSEKNFKGNLEDLSERFSRTLGRIPVIQFNESYIDLPLFVKYLEGEKTLESQNFYNPE